MNVTDIIVTLAGVCMIISPILWPFLNQPAVWLVGANAWWLLIIVCLKLERRNNVD